MSARLRTSSSSKAVKHDPADLFLVNGHINQDWDFVVQAIMGCQYVGEFNGARRSPAQIVRSGDHCFCRGVCSASLSRQIAYCRITSDQATYSWVSDVVVHPDFRRRGIGRFLLESIMNDPIFSRTYIDLSTVDQQAFYGKLGFHLAMHLGVGPRG